MNLQDLGYNQLLDKYRTTEGLTCYEVGRVILEHKERYILKTPDMEYEAELVGNLRFTAESREDFPAVGDWVAFSTYDTGKALIHAVYPRSSVIERQAVGKTGQTQIIATNVDNGLIVQAVDRDFNLNRLERYLTICHTSKINPYIILSKTDLIDANALSELIQQVQQRIKNVPVLTVSNTTDGYQQLSTVISKGQTYCLLGSSGVGKSTLLNHLSGVDLMKTSQISDSVNKGRHTTSHRELVVLENGGILIDNPGMREVGITDDSKGLEMTFDAILAYEDDCRYADCTHMHEKGCAIIAAVESGEIDEASYENFKKMEKEKQHYESDRIQLKKKDKQLGKMIKEVQKQRNYKRYR